MKNLHLPRPVFFISFLACNGQPCNRFDLMVPNITTIIAFNLSIKGIVVKTQSVVLLLGKMFHQVHNRSFCRTISVLLITFPLSKKKSYIIPVWPALTNILNHHFTDFLGGYTVIYTDISDLGPLFYIFKCANQNGYVTSNQLTK